MYASLGTLALDQCFLTFRKTIHTTLLFNENFIRTA